MGQQHHYPIPSSLRQLLAYAERASLSGRYQTVQRAHNVWAARVIILDREFTGQGSDKRAALNRAAEAAARFLQDQGHNVYSRRDWLGPGHWKGGGAGQYLGRPKDAP